MGTLKEDLIAARRVIEDATVWSKSAGYFGETYCAITCVLATPIKDEYVRQDRVWRALAEALPSSRWDSSVIAFNDHPSTTHADVMALFQRAIDACED